MSVEREFDPKQAQNFLIRELGLLIETNERQQIEFQKTSNRPTGVKQILVACMDERNTLTEEALGLRPASIQRFASGGGKVKAEDFLRLYQPTTGDVGSNTAIYLTTHGVEGSPELGCAAFKCDMPEQERYFTNLRRQLAKKLPAALIHVLSYDTATDGLRGIELDPRDKQFVALVTSGGRPLVTPRLDRAHGGFGIYIGNNYRAWVSKYNSYFHISPQAPSLRSDLDIALGVILHHSMVDLTDKPIVILLDRDNQLGVDEYTSHEVTDFLNSPDVTNLRETGRLQLIELETDPKTWIGRVLAKVLTKVE